MISGIRKSTGAVLATLVTVLTLGRVRVNWTGGPGASDEADDPARPAVTRPVEPAQRPPGQRQGSGGH